MFYKIVHALTPIYLRQACTIIPHSTNNYNMADTIMPDHLCNILLEGSSDLSLSENRKLLELVFDMMKESGRYMLYDDDVAPNVSIDNFNACSS